ncbi:MAG: 4Fe-4S dicluster domain-containing protein [Wujia sp.]
MMKIVPVLYEKKEECCGCTACYAICPQCAIRMEEDEEGFEYPEINSDLCVGCGMCLKVCPFKS